MRNPKSTSGSFVPSSGQLLLATTMALGILGVLNDNNFPFSVGRHVGAGQPDDNEFIVIELDRPLGTTRR